MDETRDVYELLAALDKLNEPDNNDFFLSMNKKELVEEELMYLKFLEIDTNSTHDDETLFTKDEVLKWHNCANENLIKISKARKINNF
jgi:exoribonuclease II